MNRQDAKEPGLELVELKAVEALAPIHRAQLLSYLKAFGLEVGLNPFKILASWRLILIFDAVVLARQRTVGARP